VPDDELLTTTQAAQLASEWRHIASGGRTAPVRLPVICNWSARGYLPVAGITAQGRPLYRPADLARAELTTRKWALRRAGIGGT
jgi:hypothetical protein